MTLRQKAFFELRYLIAAPIILFMLLQFAILFWLFHTFWKGEKTWSAYLVFGIPATIFSLENMIFTLTVGTWIFWDRPRELAFSERLRRYTYETPHEVYGVSRMANAVNYWDPGHI